MPEKAEIKVIKECSKLIRVLCGVKGLGWYHTFDKDPLRIADAEMVLNTLADVLGSIRNLLNQIENIKNLKTQFEKGMENEKYSD